MYDRWEVEEALRLSKRILPIVAMPLGGAQPPQQLERLNYIHSGKFLAKLEGHTQAIASVVFSEPRLQSPCFEKTCTFVTVVGKLAKALPRNWSEGANGVPVAPRASRNLGSELIAGIAASG